jgi:hypothetical protein
MDLARRRRKSNLLIFGGVVVFVLTACCVFGAPPILPGPTCALLGGVVDCDGTLECDTSSRHSGGRNYYNLRAQCDGVAVSTVPIYAVSCTLMFLSGLVFAVAMVVAIRIRPRRGDYAQQAGVAIIDLRRR